MPFDYIVSNNGEYLIDENGNYIINGESDVTDISINYHTVISFPDEPITPITTGIEAGSLLVNQILYTGNIKVGEINSSRFEVVVYGIDDITNKKIYVYQQHNTNPSDIIPLFTGYVNSCKVDRNEYYRKIIAYDEFFTTGNLDISDWWNSYWNSHGTGSSIRDLRNALLSDPTYGLTIAQDESAATFINDDVVVLQFAGVSGLKMGTLLSYIAEVNGVNPYLDPKGELRFYNPKYSPDFTTYNIDNKYEGQNTDFEKFVTVRVDKVIILGEANAESGRYAPTGSDEANIYVIKDNPLLYNIVPPTGQTQPDVYNTICENLFGILGFSELSYTPAKIKMILANSQIRLGDYVNANIKSGLVKSLVTQVTRSGPLLIEQSFVSSGSEKLPTVDYSPTAGQIKEISDEVKKTNEHFIWVQNDGAYVTTDVTSAGVAPTKNFSKLTSKGLNVTAGGTETTNGKNVAFFGVDNNNTPITRLGIEDEQHLIVSNNSMEMLTLHQDPFFHVGKLPTAVPVSHIDTSVTFDNAIAQSSYELEISTTYFGNNFTEAPYTSEFTVSRGNDSVTFVVDNWTRTDVSFGDSSTDITFIFGANSRARLETYLGTIQAGDVFTITMRGTYKYTVDVNECIMSFGDNDFSHNGDYSTVLGLRNTATNKFAIAGGWYNDVSGEAGVALGSSNSVTNDYSAAIGSYLTTAGKGQVVLGRFNSPITNSPFIVGDGYINAPHNAIWVDSNGNTNFGGQVISTTIGSYHNMPHLKWNEIDPQGGSASSIEVRAVGGNQQAVAMIDVNGTHHVLSDEQGQFIPEKADTSALNAVVSALGSVTVAGEFSGLDVSVDEDLVDLEAGTYLILADFHIDITVQTTADVMGSISICDSNNNYLDSMLTKRFYLPAPTGTIFPRQELTMIAAVTTSTTKSCHVEYSEASGGVYSDAYIKVTYVKLK